MQLTSEDLRVSVKEKLIVATIQVTSPFPGGF